jgi:FkbM family methyltransferase
MIPSIDVLESAAGRVMRSLPDGLMRGEVSAGLYGIGFLGRWALSQLKEQTVRIESCFDGNAAIAGRMCDELPVHSAEELVSSAPEFVFITARHAVRPISERLASLGIAHVSYDAWYAASHFAAFRQVHDEHLRDERSREVLCSVMMAMLTGDNQHCAAVLEKDQYFCLPRFHGWQNEVYVDAGAFAGDSVERFLWACNGVFSQIHAFEPGARPFAALQARTRRLIEEWALNPNSIALVNTGLGTAHGMRSARSGSGQMTNLAIGQNVNTDGVTVEIQALDNYLAGSPITFLKADVEGMEMALLKGARSTIEHHKPKIAICVYHYPADIPEIAGYLAELVPGYKFALRHHSPQLMETVLYCWTV